MLLRPLLVSLPSRGPGSGGGGVGGRGGEGKKVASFCRLDTIKGITIRF